MDCFTGYPDASDSCVPFFDIDYGENLYPLKGDHIPLDWQLEDMADGEGEFKLLREW